MSDNPPAGAGSTTDLARMVLRQAREDARRGRFTDSSTPAARRRARGRTPAVHIGQALLDLFAQAVPSPLPAWSSVAGPLSRHVAPTAFDSETGTLTLAADSTAWLTQTRLLADPLMRGLNAVLGTGTVRTIRLVKQIPPPLVTVAPAASLPSDGVRAHPEPAAAPPDPTIEAALNRQARQLPRENSQFIHSGEQKKTVIMESWARLR